jgi:hypothetical protein
MISSKNSFWVYPNGCFDNYEKPNDSSKFIHPKVVSKSRRLWFLHY